MNKVMPFFLIMVFLTTTMWAMEEGSCSAEARLTALEQKVKHLERK